MIRKIIILIFVVVVNWYGQAQQFQQKIGTNPTVIEPSAALEVESANKGVLIPRIALTSDTDVTTINTPVTSLLIYNTATSGTTPNNITPGFYYWNGSKWLAIAATESGGNSITIGNTVVSPIHSTTGKVWMDRNLGASRKAQSVTDHLAYGQLYQWGRGNDGHADVNWSATTGTPVNGTTTTLSTTDNPAYNLFIISYDDWRATQNDNLWQGASGINNPCPAGYRLPTNTELTAEVTAYSITNSATAFASPLKFTVPGYRYYSDGDITLSGYMGFYWSSSISSSSASLRIFDANGTVINQNFRGFGCTVRCIKN